jgi:uncharacterized protein (TIGR03089 family)
MAQTDPPSFAAVWRSRVADQGPKPFLTFYDAGSGERVELSYTTFDNWLCKTGNLIQDELLAEPGDRIALLARPHWLTAVWALAPLLAGVALAPWGDPADAHTVVAGPESLDEARGGSAELWALSLLPLGMPFREVPAGFRDFSAEVRAHADRFSPLDPPSGQTVALIGADGTELTHRELVETARPAQAGGLTAADRLLVAVGRDRFSADELTEWLYAPVSAGASVVLVRGADQAQQDRIAETERTTGLYLLD